MPSTSPAARLVRSRLLQAMAFAKSFNTTSQTVFIALRLFVLYSKKNQ